MGVSENTARVFREKEIDGRVLTSITENEFKEEFAISYGQRKKIQMHLDDMLTKDKSM